MFIFIVVLLILGVIAATTLTFKATDEVDAAIAAFIISCLIALVLTGLSIKIVGICNDVSETEMIGYVANVSYGGALFKTVEVNVYVDKNTSSVSLAFSSPDAKYYEILKKLSGKRIKITSKDSWVQPWYNGNSSRRIMSVEEIVDAEKP